MMRNAIPVPNRSGRRNAPRRISLLAVLHLAGLILLGLGADDTFLRKPRATICLSCHTK